MKDVLITGGAGQLGLELGALDWGEAVRIHRPSRAELDLGSAHSVAAVFEHYKFAAVINAGAYTAVDRAETDVGAAFAANALGPALLAEATARTGALLIHISTDYVFDGAKDAPYVEDDPVGPLGVYGASKLAGEWAVRTGNPLSLVLRTAWVLSRRRSNFLKTVLNLSASRPEIRIVADQIGCPTAAGDIARAVQTMLAAFLDTKDAPTGVYHFVNSGEASWCDLATAVLEEYAHNGQPRSVVTPITTAEYPTTARRPANSRLSTEKISRDFGIKPRPWRTAVAEIINQIKSQEPFEGTRS